MNLMPLSGPNGKPLPAESPVDVIAIPAPFRNETAAMLKRLLREFPRTVGLYLIGSMADGTWEPDSDVDIVWIYSGRQKRRWWDIIERDPESRIQLVPFNLTHVRKHFKIGSPMAHALRAGMPLYDPTGRHAVWRRRPLGLPARSWIEETYTFMRRRMVWGL